MTSGDPHVPPRAAPDGEWIDEILDRAAEPAVRPTTHPADPSPLPRVARARDTAPLPKVQADSAQSAATVGAARDSLAEVSWFDQLQQAPSAEPVPAVTPLPQPTEATEPRVDGVGALDPRVVNRSAWSDDLRSVGQGDPDGWDKLSWQDLDDKPARSKSLAEPAPFVRLLREWGPVLIAAVAIALFTRLFLVQAYHIPSLSMAPTLQEGDRVIVNRLSYDFGSIERGQVIVFSTPPSQESEANDLIKRVIALPGETVQFRNGEVYVDGLLLQETYIAQQGTSRARSFSIPGCAQDEPAPDICEVPDGFVFVMGDNRTGSQDSRVFGPVPAETVVGRAMMRVWPLTDIGEL